ncbi:MAG: type II toxin-antitoxin system RelB/DinJ family antitoxin [Treponema sp.]|nr:type II toxin-antitoxin system RelB/DinJ family antitoxin [Candidatus Treponema equifaecale]
MAVVSVNVENADKNSFSKICADLGMNVSTAINIFIKAVNRTHGIPFELTTAVGKNKKELTPENISKMISAANAGDFVESPAAIDNLRELTKNDVW